MASSLQVSVRDVPHTHSIGSSVGLPTAPRDAPARSCRLPLTPALTRARGRAHAVPEIENGVKAWRGPRSPPPSCRAVLRGDTPFAWARRGLGEPRSLPATRVLRSGTSSQSGRLPFARHRQTSRVWGTPHGACPYSLPHENWGFPSPGINPWHWGTSRGCQRRDVALSR